MFPLLSINPKFPSFSKTARPFLKGVIFEYSKPAIDLTFLLMIPNLPFSFTEANPSLKAD